MLQQGKHYNFTFITRQDKFICITHFICRDDSKRLRKTQIAVDYSGTGGPEVQNTMTKDKSQQQKRKHDTLIKTEKVGTL